jgi:predicted glycosyltransferase
MTRPAVLFYCQHSLGLGHLARSLALAEGLARDLDVVLLNGGRLPAGTRVPAGVRLVNLPPLGHAADYSLVSHDPAVSVADALERRRRILLDTFAATRPAAVLVELFPFGRKKFASELLPLLDAATAAGARVVCSVRDILVGQRRDQPAHDERASVLVNRYFDAVLVHTDPAFARLEDSFAPATPLRVPVHHTGFVAPPASRQGFVRECDVVPRLLVSAGGGMVGAPLFRAAVDAHRALADRTGLRTTVVAGPFLPEADWAALRERAAREPMLDAVRRVDDLAAEIRRSALSLSQCGYNTAMDLLRAGTPALVVPFAEGREDEQRRRAQRLAALGLLRVLDRPDPGPLADALCALRSFRPATTGLDLDGRDAAARIVTRLVAPAAVAS